MIRTITGAYHWSSNHPAAASDFPFQNRPTGDSGALVFLTDMLIAIDFDDTLTADANLWRQFFHIADQLGHRVICVTARRETEDNIDTIQNWMRAHGVELPVYFSSLGSKVDFMSKRGQAVDIWIDDDPKRCALGH